MRRAPKTVAPPGLCTPYWCAFFLTCVQHYMIGAFASRTDRLERWGGGEELSGGESPRPSGAPSLAQPPPRARTRGVAWLVSGMYGHAGAVKWSLNSKPFPRRLGTNTPNTPSPWGKAPPRVGASAAYSIFDVF